MKRFIFAGRLTLLTLVVLAAFSLLGRVMGWKDTTFDLLLRDWSRGDWGGVALETVVLVLCTGFFTWFAYALYVEYDISRAWRAIKKITGSTIDDDGAIW